MLFEAAVLGFVASVLGVMLGSLLMWGMCVSDIMQEGMRFNFSWQAAVIPILFGIVVTVLASLIRTFRYCGDAIGGIAPD